MRNLLKEWFNNRKQREQRAHRVNMCRQFQIDERAGEVFILCNGVAVRQMAAESSVKDVSEALDVMRTAAIKFDALNS